MPGSSAWFDGGVVAYSYEAKEALLGVHPQTLEQNGAVSQEIVPEMVSGALARFGAGVAVAVTGIAGPGGGTEDKPVGTVWIGWKRRGGYAHSAAVPFRGRSRGGAPADRGRAFEGSGNPYGLSRAAPMGRWPGLWNNEGRSA